jgi:predicted phosphoribosyltransferase
MRFHSREEAARLLAERLDVYRGQEPVVLGIPRGGVPMARIIADRLKGELDVVLVHKITLPDDPEFAIGAVDEWGEIYENPDAVLLGVRPEILGEAAQRQVEPLRERRRRYGRGRPSATPEHRIVIVVDDGLATGSTMIAALRAVRARSPARLVAATAVAPSTTADLLRDYADEVAVLHVPRLFHAVGAFFEDFREVTEEDVIAALRPPARASR